MAFAAWAWTTAPSGARSNGKPREGCRRNGDPERNGPSIFTARQEQLGLELEPAREAVPVLVIDSVDRPTED